jgi:hypothetical protein
MNKSPQNDIGLMVIRPLFPDEPCKIFLVRVQKPKDNKTDKDKKKKSE